jgi:hypothetical protein
VLEIRDWLCGSKFLPKQGSQLIGRSTEHNLRSALAQLAANRSHQSDHGGQIGNDGCGDAKHVAELSSTAAIMEMAEE